MENNQNPYLPFGFHFCPTAYQLIILYLLNRILGRNLPADMIPTFDCFSVSPFNLPFGLSKYGVENEWFFYTRKREGDVVVTDEGSYEVYAEKLKFDGNNKVYGIVRTFKFFYGKPPSGVLATEWTIKEYRVHPQILNLGRPNRTMDSNIVACKIIRHVDEATTSRAVENTSRGNGDSSSEE